MLCSLAADRVRSSRLNFRVTAIPDESPTELARKAAPLVNYLESEARHEGRIHARHRLRGRGRSADQPQVDWPGSAASPSSRRSMRSGGKVIPLVQREEDEKFRSVFISADPAIKSLADLKGRNFSFGSQSSTAGT